MDAARDNEGGAAPEGAAGELDGAFERLRAGFAADPYPSHATRIGWLDALERALLDRREALAEAVRSDFGARSRHETLVAEVFVTVSAIRYLKAGLRGWMKPVARHVSWIFRPGKAAVHWQPLGVVGVISPWNYPIQLALAPLATALAAGNRVLLKPSELTPATSALLAELLASALPSDVVGTVLGDAAVGAAFARLPFDHLVFTGSTAVGRLVMKAAAENLTPVTLELGGKSPVVVAPGFDLRRAAERVAYGKLLNAGQTCIAPDYAIVPAGQEAAFADAFAGAVARLYPTLAGNPDYSAIINPRHHERLQRLVDDARARGADVRVVNPAGESFTDRRMPPHVVLRPTDTMAVMQEEIFGPVLPVVGVPDLGAAIAHVNARPRPLALYLFSDEPADHARVLHGTHSGGVSINDTLLHLAQDDLPFGGVGPSGIGRYHGPEGFQAFSHPKAVFHQARLNGGWLTAPPYGAGIERLLKILLGR